MTTTREKFIAATGREPQDDDLERCNCPHAGETTHTQCGWGHDQNLPKFLALPVGVKMQGSESYVIAHKGCRPVQVFADGRVEKLYPVKSPPS